MQEVKANTIIKVKTLKVYPNTGFMSEETNFTNQEKIVHKFENPTSNLFSPTASITKDTPKHKAFEKFNLKKLKALQYLLVDILETYELDEKTREWYETYYKKVCDLLQNRHSALYFCNTKHLYVLMKYRQKKKKLHVGRLYSKNPCSYAYFAREMRGFLIQHSEYYDFDIVNAHPTMLLEYALNHMGNYTPKVLKHYVYNRENLLKEKSLRDKSTLADAKEEILVAMNCTPSDARNLGSFSAEFFEECLFIREHIYKSMYYKGSAIYEYYKDSEKFHKKSLEKQKVSVQSIYLQSKETDYVYELILYLRHTTRDWLNSLDAESIKSFDSMLINKKHEIDRVDFYITCIPFYDGLYIGSEDSLFHKTIPAMVDAFNESLKQDGSLIKFKEKKIAYEGTRINPTLFKFYTSICTYINSLSTKQFNELLNVIKIPPLLFSNECRLEEMVTISREFRRELFKRLVEISDNYKIPLNPDFITKARSVLNTDVELKKGTREWIKDIEKGMESEKLSSPIEEEK